MRTPTAKKPPFKKHPLTIALQACAYAVLGASPLAVAAPTGGAVVGGSGTISQSGTATTINQATQNLAINWQSFDVAANERVQFIQPNSTSVALNRILSNNGSTIAGRIDANGTVILANSSGVFFTSTAVLNVGSIIASGLDINPTSFMNNQYIFNEIPGSSGAVINNGMINASLGGNVALIGKHVENNGLIVANLGTVSLAAGKQAVLTFDSGGLLGVRVSQEILQNELGVDPAVINSGEIQAQGGRVLLTASQSQDVFSRAVNTTGMEPATSVVVNDDGTFTLGSGADVLNSGTINTSGTGANQNGGRIVLLGNNVTSSGTLRADAQSGNGGEIELHSTNMTLLTQNSLTSARSESNGKGGIVKVLGDKVGLFDQSRVDVSGANGGGQALIGGDFQGKNTNIRNASRTIVATGSSIFADATNNGNGGKVILWANEYTRFFGSIFARGGSEGGNGGFAEVSGKEGLQYVGFTDLTAASGRLGTLLLDPKFIRINNNTSEASLSNGDYNDFAFGSNSSDWDLNAATLSIQLDTANVRLQANTDIIVENDINIAASIPANVDGSTGNLQLHAGRSITLGTNATITLLGGNFEAIINHSGAESGNRNANPAEFSMGSGSSIITKGGNITIETGDFGGGGAANIGNFTLQTLNSTGQNAASNAALTGNTGGNAGIINVTNAVGNISVNGPITAQGGVGGSSTTAGATGGTGGAGGNIALTATLGNITTAVNGQITALGGAGASGTGVGATGGNGGAGGDITLTANLGNITVGAAISSNGGEGAAGNAADGLVAGGTGGAGGAGGNVVLAAASQSIIANAPISSSGGAGGMGGAGFNDGFTVQPGGSGGAGEVAGTITLTVGANLTVNADIVAAGGAGGGPGANAGGGTGLAGNTIVGNTIILSGSSGDNTFTINDVTLTGSLVGVEVRGQGGNDQLVRGGSLNNTWTVTGTDSGTLAFGTSTPITFSGMESLIGSAAQDTFNITALGSLSGLMDGGGGALDALTFSASNVTLRLSNTLSHTDAVNDTTSLNVARIESITAASGSTGNTILGENVATTWTVNGTNSGIIAPTAGGIPENTITFNNIGTLTGGNLTDTFNVTGGSIGALNGGDGVITDIFNVTGGIATIMNGGDGNDSFTVVAAGGTTTLNGGAGTNTLTFNGTTGNDSIALGASTLSSGGFTLNYSSLNDITIDTLAGIDSVALSSVLLVGGTLRLANTETVTGTSTALTANTLFLDNVGQFGAAGALIGTTIDTLNLTGPASQIYINESTGLDVFMTAAGVNSASVFQVVGTTTIDAAGSALVLNAAANDFDTVTINNAASITLSDRDAITMNAVTGSITLNAAGGIGTVSTLNTTTANLTVTNTLGDVNITNNGAVSASVITAGNINFTNNGTVTIRQLNTFGGGIPGNLDSSFGANINLIVNNGAVYGTNYVAGASSPIPDIVAQTFTGSIISGSPGHDFGAAGMPVNVMVRSRFDLTAYGHSAFIQFIPSRPAGDILADLTVSNDSVGGIDTRLLEIDSLDEFDPAIFTEIRNYYYEDVAIMMPADQRLDATDEEEKDESKEGKL